MTPLEREALDAFYVVRDRFTARALTVESFMKGMNAVRMMIKKLENASFGCPTGLHTSECTCKQAKAGVTLSTIKHRSLL